MVLLKKCYICGRVRMQYCVFLIPAKLIKKRKSEIIMSLQDTMNKSGHAAKCGIKTAVKAITKPVNTFIALATIATIMSTSEVKAQNYNPQGDTLWGTGFFVTQNIDDGENIGNVSLYLRPENMAMATPNITYELTTASNGLAPYRLPVYIDSTTGIKDIVKNEVQVLPTFGSELNAFFPKIEKGTIEIYNMNGQLVQKQDFNTDHEYLQFNDVASGMYIYNIRTESGVNLGGKFLKQNVPLKGPSAKPINNTNSTFKETQIYSATYWAKWVHPDFHTDSTLITLEEGENNPIFLYMTSSIPPPIDNQDLEGYVWKLENTNLALPNAQVRATVNSTGAQYNAVSDNNGHFIINDLPLGEEITFDVGGIPGRYSFAGINYTTPSSIENPADSVNSNFGAVLPLKLASSSAQHIKNQTSNGTHQETIWFYLGNSFNTTAKNTIRNYFTNLQSDENNVYIFAESDTELNNTGINIQYGTYNTQAYNDEVNTPFGGILYPVMYANSTMGIGSYIGFVHEIKRALGFDEVSWYSVMQTPVQGYTQEDKDIAQFVERPYWNSVYQENKTWIDLNKIVEEMPGSKSMQSSNTSNSYNEGLEFNYQTK